METLTLLDNNNEWIKNKFEIELKLRQLIGISKKATISNNASIEPSEVLEQLKTYINQINKIIKQDLKQEQS